MFSTISSARSRLCAAMLQMPLVALVCIGCAAEIEPEVASAEAELFGGLKTNDCSASHAQMIRDAWTIGKIVAKDYFFEQCVLGASYIACDDDEDPRKSTALAVTQSPNITAVRCRDFDDDSTGGEAGPNQGPLHTKNEELGINRQVLDNNASSSLDIRSGIVAGILWHEVSHTHGFQHGNGTDVSRYARDCGRDPAAWDYRTNSMPYIVGDCMRLTLWDMVESRFQRHLGRSATSAEETRFFGWLRDGTITSGIELSHAILRLDAPSNLRTGVINGTNVELRWNDNSFNETYFQVVGQQGFSSVIAPNAPENATSVTLRNLTPATTYRFWVKACHASGCSVSSNELVVTTPNTLPTAPQNFTVTSAGTDRLTLGWQATNGSYPRTSYRLTWIGGSLSSWRSATLAASATSYVALNLQPNTSYQFHLLACNNDGCASSVSSVGTTLALAAIPAAPSNLRVTSSTPTTINLAWNDNGPPITNISEQLHFELEWALATAGGGGPGGANLIWSTIVFPGRQTTYAFPVNVQTIHYFRVRACNIGGCSSPSNQVSRTPN